jgi:hypothetical protein
VKVLARSSNQLDDGPTISAIHEDHYAGAGWVLSLNFLGRAQKVAVPLFKKNQAGCEIASGPLILCQVITGFFRMSIGRLPA